MKTTIDPMAHIFRYTIKSTGYSSERYGKCEVCAEHCSEVHLQTEKRRYVTDALDTEGADQERWTQHGCRAMTFGHHACLMRSRHA